MMPTVVVTPSGCQSNGFIYQPLAVQWKAVPMPSYVEPATGTDSQMTIYQPSTDTIWEFWKAGKTRRKMASLLGRAHGWRFKG